MAASRSNKPAGEPENQPVPEGDDVAKAVQHATDRAQEQGFYGVATDPTPSEHYTVAGVTAGKPTPETDVDHAREVRQKLDDDARKN
ncbi:hypothetical protein [Streptomyces sp. SCL15-4]|uniref:hypothetical protein n=1 Tax=Streptomyces sp. SCL15-4 TaxID=2967221 RepID=UPI0029676131|nr:hypothetical protein [Streptomyces sp. SCL15-4]